MKNLLKLFLMSFIITIPTMAWSAELYVSGKITDTGNEPIIGATITIPNTTQGTTSDINGEFEHTFKNVDDPANVKLEISYLGYKPQNITPGTDLEITLVETSNELDDIVVTVCGSRPAEGRKTQAFKDPENTDKGCYPTACYDEFKLTGNGIDAQCVARNCRENNGSGKYAYDENTKGFYCKLDKCDSNKYELVDNICKKIPTDCSQEQLKEHPNATKTDLDSARNCIALDCQCGYDVQAGKCVAWTIDENGKYKKPCDDNQLKKLNAKSGILYCENDKPKCEITACISDDYTHNTQNNSCDNKNKQPCTHGDKNATDAEYKKIDGKLTCVINDCRAGYKPNSDGTACTPQRVLSESDSQAKINELKDNAQKMKDKEQSTANKLLGAAGIGATGIGGMQLASAMAEDNADDAAEESMRAYLATFHCNYGDGKNIRGGERDIELPGGNELIGLYSEYVNLANDLKVRKTALDMRPGIESEPILDAATSGLYDDVAIGKTSGAYTSLARALMDPNGADAAAWAQQRADTADKKKAGLITAGIGAAGSLVGNLAINSGKNKQNKVDEILNKFDKKRQLITELESNIAALPPQIVPCPDGTTGEKQPDCTCADNKKFFNPKTTTCEDCPGDLVVIDGKCQCPSDKPLSAPDSNKCYAMPQQCTPECDPTSDPNLQPLPDCSCICKNHFDYIDGKCKCEGANKHVVSGQCQIVTVETVTETQTIVETETIVEQILTETTTSATLPTDSLFDLGKSTLRSDAKAHISNFINQLSKNGYTNCSIQIDGYTDPLGTTARNQTLSQQRADAVKKYISGLNNSAIKSITATGHGENDCTCGAAQDRQIDYNNYEYKICKGKAAEYQLTGDARYAPCRRVVITPTCDTTRTTVTKQ